MFDDFKELTAFVIKGFFVWLWAFILVSGLLFVTGFTIYKIAQLLGVS